MLYIYKIGIILLIMISLSGLSQIETYANSLNIVVVENEQVTDSLYTLKSSNISLTIDTRIGARIVSLKFKNEELLTPNSVHPNFYGSSLWLSPEGKWRGHGILDRSFYDVEEANTLNLLVKSQKDYDRGFEFKKDFRANSADTSFVIQYTITNISENEQEVAAWEVTRVPTGGLAFFPKGNDPALSKSNLVVQDSIGMIWYSYDPTVSESQKLFMNGSEGWLAHVQNGIIFIKLFPKIEPEETAPGEESVEIYVNPDNTYIELENQGSYQRLLNEESLTYSVKWYVRQLPGHIQYDVGSKDLVEYVRKLVKRSEL